MSLRDDGYGDRGAPPPGEPRRPGGTDALAIVSFAPGSAWLGWIGVLAMAGGTV